jgi:hypothetical protein
MTSLLFQLVRFYLQSLTDDSECLVGVPKPEQRAVSPPLVGRSVKRPLSATTPESRDAVPRAVKRRRLVQPGAVSPEPRPQAPLRKPSRWDVPPPMDNVERCNFFFDCDAAHTH